TISDESVDSSPGPVTMKNHAGERGGVSVLVHQWPVDFGLRGTHAVEPGKSMTADADELVTRPERGLKPRLQLQPTRREFLLRAGGGVGGLALAAMIGRHQSLVARAADTGTATSPLAPRKPHFAPQARRMIWLFMHGGPSHVDLFDPKPDLIK